jgi:hypothetical protein
MTPHLPPAPPCHLTPTRPSFARSIHHALGPPTAITNARDLARKEDKQFALEVQRMIETQMTAAELQQDRPPEVVNRLR